MAESSSSTRMTVRLPRMRHLGVIIGLAMGPAIGLGLARFAYALLLPAMRTDLGWSYASAGAINTANAAGYLIGAMFAAPVAKRAGEVRTFLLGLLITVVALLASGMTGNFTVLSLLRLLAGVSAALSFVTGGTLASAAATDGGGRGWPAVALGIYFGGAGFGMLVSAFALPTLVAMAGWRAGWIALSVLALTGTVVALPALSRVPSVHSLHHAAERRGSHAPWSMRRLLPLMISYLLFGAGYIAYMTFIVAYLHTQLGFTPHDVTFFWTCASVAAIAAGVMWGPLLTALSGGRAIALANAVVAAGAILPVLSDSWPLAYISAVLFGGSFLIVPTSVTAFTRKIVGPQAWTAAIAANTIGFAFGQCLGPVMSGLVSDQSYGLGGGLLLSAFILIVAALIALLQHEPRAG